MNQPGDSIEYCWHCGEKRALTKDHTPPQSAFNEGEVKLKRVSDQSREKGILEWVDGPQFQNGYFLKSVCSACNGMAGRSLAPSYRALVEQVRLLLPLTPLLGHMDIGKVLRPQLVLRQVLFQFISANGPKFVQANPWIRDFIDRRGVNLPEDIGVYLFATNHRAMKTTGVSGHIVAGSNEVRVVSEFTFPPLGTVLSFGKLKNEGLTPIHQWGRFPFASKRTESLRLRVNPVNTPLPIDFRLLSQVFFDRLGVLPQPPIQAALLPELHRLVRLHSGHDDGFDTLVGMRGANLV